MSKLDLNNIQRFLHSFPLSQNKDAVFGDEEDIQIFGVETKDGELLPGESFPEPEDQIFEFDDQNLMSLADKNFNVFGDIRNLFLIAEGGDVKGDGHFVSDISGYQFTMGDDQLIYGDGDNCLRGDFSNLLLVAKGGNVAADKTTSDPTGQSLSSQGQIIGNTITGGSNHIEAGDGDNKIFGNAEDILLAAIAGRNVDGAGFGANLAEQEGSLGQIIGNTIDLSAGNTLYVGNGDNEIYGNVRNIEFIADGGESISKRDDAVPASTTSFGFIFGNEILMGGDEIRAGDGNNSIFGDAHDIKLTAKGGTLMGPGTEAIGGILNNIITTGDDTIEAEHGTNWVSGDIHDYTLVAMAGRAKGNEITPGAIGQGFLITSTFGVDAPLKDSGLLLGDDTITLGDGGNTVVGDLNDLTIMSISKTDDSLVTPTSLAAFMAYEYAQMGDDVITTGAGDDLISGDGFDIHFRVEAGDAKRYDAGAMGSNWQIDPGNDTIHAGSGDDVLYGDFANVLYSVKAGSANNEGSFATAQLRQNPLFITLTPFEPENYSLMLGHDELHGQDGHNLIYGDINNLEFSVIGGIVGPNGGDASAHLVTSRVFFGDDDLMGGSSSDELYGDLKSLSFELQNGVDLSGEGNASASFAGGFIENSGGVFRPDFGSLIEFGDDKLIGGGGDDLLVGDVYHIEGLDAYFTSNSGMGIAGTGPITDDAENLVGLNPTNLNVIIWGDDTLTGNEGSDIFSFTLVDLEPLVQPDNSIVLGDGKLEMQGNDIITDDFNLLEDILQFKNVSSLEELVNSTEFESSGEDTIIHFDDSFYRRITDFNNFEGNEEDTVNLEHVEVTSSLTLQGVVVDSWGEFLDLEGNLVLIE